MKTEFDTYDSAEDAELHYTPPEGEDIHDRLGTYRALRDQLVEVVEKHGHGVQASAGGDISDITVHFESENIDGYIMFSMYPTYQVIESDSLTVNGEGREISTDAYDAADWLDNFLADL